MVERPQIPGPDEILPSAINNHPTHVGASSDFKFNPMPCSAEGGISKRRVEEKKPKTGKYVRTNDDIALMSFVEMAA